MLECVLLVWWIVYSLFGDGKGLGWKNVGYVRFGSCVNIVVVNISWEIYFVSKLDLIVVNSFLFSFIN